MRSIQKGLMNWLMVHRLPENEVTFKAIKGYNLVLSKSQQQQLMVYPSSLNFTSVFTSKMYENVEL